MRLIDANALLQSEVKRCRCIPTIGSGYSNETSFKLILDEAPTVDAVEVVNAEWACVNESENVWMCTGKNGCGNEILLLEGTPNENGWNYCPNCGAKMDGEREDNG